MRGCWGSSAKRIPVNVWGGSEKEKREDLSVVDTVLAQVKGGLAPAAA